MYIDVARIVRERATHAFLFSLRLADAFAGEEKIASAATRAIEEKWPWKKAECWKRDENAEEIALGLAHDVVIV